MSSDSKVADLTPLQKWLVLITAAIGFAFDIYELLMLPLFGPPAIRALAPGAEVSDWMQFFFYVPAVCGGIFGLLGGWLTDRFGRRSVLTYSILLYATATAAGAFAPNLWFLLVCRSLAFIGVCVEFVAAVAWLAELFDDPTERENAIGYTQAFSSFGGLMVHGMYYFILWLIPQFPDLLRQEDAWRYLLLTGLIPALPLIIVRPFLPESPTWERKSAEGTLKRPSVMELFSPGLILPTLVTTIMFACSYGIAFGAIQQLTQIVPTIPEVRDWKPEPKAKPADSPSPEGANPAADKPAADQPAPEKPADVPAAKGAETPSAGSAAAAKPADKKGPPGKSPPDPVKQKHTQQTVTVVGFFQEIGGLIGRFALAILVTWSISRRSLLWIFQVPGLIVVPLVFWLIPSQNVAFAQWGALAAGFFTVAQFSFWGNYLPRVFPIHLRGTGESFAANVGGRMFGTLAAVMTSQIFLRTNDTDPLTPPTFPLAHAAAITAGIVSVVGFLASFWLPEPQEELPE